MNERLEKLKAELEELKAERKKIKNVEYLPLELRDKCLAWYDKEIECIERYGG